MNQCIDRELKGGYNSPIWKKQCQSTFKTLQKSICTDCAKGVPNNFSIMSDAMAIDSQDQTSASANINDIIDWIEWDDEKKKFLSIFRNKVECSECGNQIKGKVVFNGYNN